MLKVPAYEYFQDLRVTAYQDDSMFWKFYCIPDYVSIRRDINNNPVFLLIKYAFGDQDREENPDLPRGAGYIAFDVELAVPEGDMTEVRRRLQTRVNQDWQRLKDMADAAGKSVRGYRVWSKHPGKPQHQLTVDDVRLGLPTDVPQAPPGDAPPKVIIAPPTWTEGTFQVSAPQSEALVTHRVTEGPISLVGSNTVAANMDLTSAGATFMERTLLDLDGTGGSDLTPIQVLYQLKFWARIPPVRLWIEADSRAVYAALKEIDHDYDNHRCSADDITHHETNLELAVQADLIKVRFDTGTLSLEDDFLQDLRSSAMRIVQDLIKDKFYTKEDAPPTDDEEDGDNFLGSKKDVYILKTDISGESTSIEYDEEMTSIVEWSANPQGTMQSFFSGLSASEMKKYVRTIDLDDDFFKTLGLTVTAFADWDNEPIAFVECQIQYSGRDENNLLVEKVETFTFTQDNSTGFWDPSLIKSQREYNYRWRVAFHGHEPDRFTRWFRDSTPNLNLSIADPGKIHIRVLAGNIDFEQTVDQVQVELRYRDAGSGVDEEATTFVLANGQTEQIYERYIYTEWDRPVQYRSRFFLKDGQQIETEWENTLSNQLLINAPLYDKLDVRLVPAGMWDNVVQSVISLQYEDSANDYHVDSAFSIKETSEFRTWSVVLQNPSDRDFTYKVLTTFENGTFNETDWIAADGDQALAVVVQEVPWLQISLLPNLVDFEVTPVVECTLRYSDEVNNIHEVETFTFTSGEVNHWSFAIADDTARTYQHEITYHLTDGRSVKMPVTTLDATSLVIAKLAVPEIHGTVLPRLIDFATTPVVEVHITYQDLEHDIDFIETLVFTEKADQTFRISLHEDSLREYTVAITYYLDSGEMIEKDPITVDRKRLILPRYRPES
ncbi:MAG: hypothetical protein AAGF01_09900 [Cyanobacteria bacterium P01_G01_bin.38]